MRRTGGPKGPVVVSILTPSILPRRDFLRECENSVKSQTFHEWEHIVEVDRNQDGCAFTMNRLAEAAHGEWLLPLADDDLILPGCLEALVSHANGSDVVYAPPLVTGNEDRWWFFQEPPAIPSFALIRKSLWAKLGGYDESLKREEDRNLWIAAMNANARFTRVDLPLWVYRQHAGNKSFNLGVAA